MSAGVTIARGMMLDGEPVMGRAIEIGAAEALARCVWIAAGEVAYCTAKIAELSEEEVLQREVTTTTEYAWSEKNREKRTRRLKREGRRRGEPPEVVEARIQRSPYGLHLWIRERHRCIDRLARLSKMALDAGIAEREVALQERMADMLVEFAQGLIAGLGLSAKQKALVPGVIQHQLIAMTGIREKEESHAA